MSIDSLSRYFTVTDGTTEFTLSFFECATLSVQLNPLDGGSNVLRFMDGSSEKQVNWTKQRITISGGGQIPIGIQRLNFDLPLTFSLNTTQAVTGTLTEVVNSLPAHRVDIGYAPMTKVLIDGIFEVYTGNNTGTVYRVEYYPVITCFCKPPSETFNSDQMLGYTWNLEGEEA